VPKGGRPLRNGRNKGLFLALPHSVLDKPEFRALSSSAKVVILAIGRFFDGRNNGKIGFSERTAGQWGLSQKTARRALIEACEAGLIVKTRAASFSSKRLAAEWAITWRPLNTPAIVSEAVVFASGKNSLTQR
jgi:hypothetical protein